MINPQWLELPMSRTNLHGPKNVRVIENRLYSVYSYKSKRDENELKGKVNNIKVKLGYCIIYK